MRHRAASNLSLPIIKLTKLVDSLSLVKASYSDGMCGQLPAHFEVYNISSCHGVQIRYYIVHIHPIPSYDRFSLGSSGLWRGCCCRAGFM